MSRDILFEVNFFLHSFLLGILITFAYDGFLILRRCFRHNIFLISLEDILFWIACALGVFYMLYRENNGILRWFAVLGATLGMWMYKRLVSTYWVNFISAFIIKTVHFILKPIAFVSKKIALFILYIRKKLTELFKYGKKKLTIQLKLIKMILCKQKAKKESGHGKKSGIPQKASK